ncbi:Uncharacterized protein FWK35_00003897, partial [Aphis craccivora]
MNLNQVIGSPGTFETGMDITIFDEEIRKVLFSLCVPSTPNEVEYDTLMKCLNKYFKPIKSYFTARYTFYQAKQRQDESVCQLGARVKNLASKCGFSSELTTVIRDMFVVAKEAAINEKSGLKKEEYADLKYQNKNNGHNQAKQGFNTHKELKIKCGICGRSNHFQKHYLATNPALKEKVETEIYRLVKSNILVPVDHSEWATPVVPILKPDDTVRICGDFKITEYPLPKIEHLYENISGSKYFSKIDLKDAYQQMVIKEFDRKYTTINTHKGLFSYTCNPFGIKSSAGEFQKVMETSIAGLECIGIFHDDIIVADSTITEHNARLDKLLNVLSNAGLRVKLSLVTHYIKFIPNAANILKPLYMLLRNGTEWNWTPECDQAFNKVKQILISKPVLAHYDHNIPIKL